MVRSRDAADVHGFGLQASALLPKGRDVRGHACAHGLEIFAADEDLLLDSLRLLRRYYGDRLAGGEIKVRLLAGDPVCEPVMAIRISSRAEFMSAILDELHRRGACLDSAPPPSGRSTLIAATARMERLLGLSAALDALTQGTAVHWIRLSHYAART